MSQQRVHVPDASLPSPGFARAFVPPLQRYYQGTATSCRPSRRVSFPSFGGTTGSRNFRSRHRYVRQRQGLGLVTRYPRPGFFRGDDRISQVPGEPQFPFAHGLRPRPAETSQTNCGTLAWPPLSARRRRQREDFRGSIARLSGSPPTYHATVIRLTAQGWLPGAGLLSWTGFYPQSSCKRFQLTSCLSLSFSKLLGTSTFSPLLPPETFWSATNMACATERRKYRPIDVRGNQRVRLRRHSNAQSGDRRQHLHAISLLGEGDILRNGAR